MQSQTTHSFFRASRLMRQSFRAHGTYLLIDDDPGILGLLEVILHRKYAKTRSVGTLLAAKEAIEEIGHENIICAIVDLKLPDGDGMEFSQWLRKTYPDIPSIIYTAHAGEATEEEVIERGIHTEVVQKGSDIENLFCALGIE
jgi:two-component system NtrC family response regulator